MKTRDVLDFLGRFFIAIIFLYEAADSIIYYEQTKITMSMEGILWNQNLLLVVSIIFLIFGGLSLLFGYRVKLAVLLLMAYYLPLTFIVHDFWNFGGMERRISAILFMKNFGMVGALLMVYIVEPGKYSIKRLVSTTKIRKF